MTPAASAAPPLPTSRSLPPPSPPPQSAVEGETTNLTSPHLASLFFSWSVAAAAAMICPAMSHPSLRCSIPCFLSPFSPSACLPEPAGRPGLNTLLGCRGECMTFHDGTTLSKWKWSSVDLSLSVPTTRLFGWPRILGGKLVFGHPVARLPRARFAVLKIMRRHHIT